MKLVKNQKLSKIVDMVKIVRNSQNIARIANAVPVTLYSRVTVNLESVVLNCQKYNQCLKGHKSPVLFFEDVFHLSLSFFFFIVFVFVIVFLLVRSCPLITLIKSLKGHKSQGSLFECVL